MAPLPREVWLVDLGMVAKTRPCLVMSPPPKDDELALHVLVARTTAVRGNRLEVNLSLPGMQPGAFHLQQWYTVPRAKMLRRLGVLSDKDFDMVKEQLKSLFGL